MLNSLIISLPKLIAAGPLEHISELWWKHAFAPHTHDYCNLEIIIINGKVCNILIAGTIQGFRFLDVHLTVYPRYKWI